MELRSNSEDAPPNTKQTHGPVYTRTYHKPKLQATHRQRHVKTIHNQEQVPQSSVLAPILFNIYTSDIPHTASTQYIYADDIALVELGLNYSDIQQTLTNDLTCIDLCLQRWCLRLNVNKKVSNCFHLTNCLANHQMEVGCGEKTIQTTTNPKYLGVTFDRSLAYSKHLSQLSKKGNARCNLLRRLAGTKWEEHFEVLHKSTIALLLRPSTVHQCGVAVPTHTDLSQHQTTASAWCRVQPIDTNGHVAIRHWDNTPRHPSKQTMPRTCSSCRSR